MRKLACVILLVAVMVAGLVHVDLAHATIESGFIIYSTTWNTAGSPYVLAGNITIDASATLTIQPGVTVDFENYQMLVNGVLLAQGSSSDVIVFSGDSDSSASITFESQSVSNVSYVSVSSVCVDVQLGAPTISFDYFASQPTQTPTITVTGGSPAIENNTINMVSTDGIDVDGGSAAILCNVIAGPETVQGIYGIYVASLAYASIVENNITGCYSGIWTLGPSIIEQNNVMNNVHDGVCSQNAGSGIEENAIADNLCGVSGDGTIENNTITGNSAGLWSPSGTILYNNIYDNYNSSGSYAQNVHLTNSLNVTAIDNWWGSTNVQTINETIWDDNKTATNLGIVQFVPFLNASNTFAPSVPSSIIIPSPPATPAPTSTPSITPTATPYVDFFTIAPSRTPQPTILFTPGAIIGHPNNSDLDNILVIVIALIVAAVTIVSINLKFGTRKAPKPTRRRRRKRKTTRKESEEPAAQPSQG